MVFLMACKKEHLMVILRVDMMDLQSEYMMV